jgi:hypothetical protein
MELELKGKEHVVVSLFAMMKMHMIVNGFLALIFRDAT